MILSPILTLDPVKVERDLEFLMSCFREGALLSRREAGWTTDILNVQYSG